MPRKKRAPQNTTDDNFKEANPNSESIEQTDNLVKKQSILNLVSRYAFWLEIAGIIFVIAVGLSMRLEDIYDWKANPQRALYKGEPLLTTFDGYYYLSLAKDIVDGTYTEIDYNRNVPEGVKRRIPPPLLSTIGAYVSKITGYSLNWVGAILPAFLGMLIIVPVYGLGRFYGGRSMALSASLFSLLSFYYLYRSSVGWFDTDCMNVTWGISALYCFLLFAKTTSPKRYLYFSLGLIIYALFIMWWDFAKAVVTVICFIPFATALVFFYRPNTKKELAIFIALNSLLIFFVLIWQGFDLPIKIVKQVLSQFHYITTKKVSDIWPPIGATISEQSIPDFNEIVQKTINSKPGFYLAGFGLILLFVKRPKDSLFLSVPIILAALSFFTAKRFLIFFAPIIALGLGYVISYLWNLKQKNKYIIMLPLALICFLAIPLYKDCMAKTFWPKEPPHLIDGFVYAGKHTPKDAILWAWWDHGYPIVYFARRGTVGDGSVHGGEISSYNGIPFATHSPRLAANFMCFYAARGFKGIKRFYKALDNDIVKGQHLMLQILKDGPEKAKKLLEANNLSPEKWLKFFYPENHRPVYLFLDWRLTVTAYWWYWLGSWDTEKRQGIHPIYQNFYNLKIVNDKIIGPNLEVDIKNGIAKIGMKLIPLKQLVVISQKGFKKIYNRKKGLDFELLAPTGFGAIMDFHISDSIFNKLFLRYAYNKKYFRPVRLRTPSHQIWEVHGDKL